MRKLTHLAAVLLLLISSLSASAYTNPVMNGDAPDPSIIKAKDGYYYMYATLGRIYRSANLTDWTWAGWAFTDDGFPKWAEFDNAAIWAPDINYINGKYVMYYSLSAWNETGKCGIGVAVSDYPVGPFEDKGKLFTSNEIGVKNSIDPYYYEDTDGKKYLVWGSFNGVYINQLSDDGMSLVGNKTQIINNTVEGSVLLKRGDYYYFIGSAGTCCEGENSTYHLVVARCTTINGTYRNKNNAAVKSTILNTSLTTILQSNDEVIAPGHCSEFFEDEDGKTWLMYHAYMKNDIAGGRKICMSEVKWDSNGWPYIEGGTPKIENEVAPKVAETQAWEINNGQDLLDFANYVNKMPTDRDRFRNISGVSAYLTQDIDMAGINFPGIGNDNHEHRRFHGTLDGRGHRIKNLKMEGDCVGLIGVASDNVVIKNLIIDSSCSFTGTGRNSAFISASNWPEWGSGKIEFINCGNEATVTGTGGNCAAYLGCNYNGGLIVEITNCYNTGNVTGGWESGAFSGWVGNGNSKLSNCWNIGEIQGVDGNNTLARGTGNYFNTYDLRAGVNRRSDNVLNNDVHKADWLTSGELAYQLNGDQTNINWYQNIGTDAHPMPFAESGQVYLTGDVRCDGLSLSEEQVYSNTAAGVLPPHTFTDGFCSVCGTFDEHGFEKVDGYFEIANANQLRWFSIYVDRIDARANARLVADIDYTAYETEYIGRAQNNAYAGTFDGQEHKITINIKSTLGATGLFCYAYDATIKNLVIDGTVTMEGHNIAGGLAGRVEGTTVENVLVYTTINDAQEGDGTIGGIFAVTAGDWKQTRIKNSAFLGKINAPKRNGNGGIVGWSDNGFNTVFTNVLVAPAELSWADGGTFTRKGCTVENCVVVLTGSYRINDTNSDKAIIATADMLATGEMAFVLNEKVDGAENWYQNLGADADATPVPFSSHKKVYANGSFTCGGEGKGAVTYSNVAGSNYDEHVFAENGICSVCKNGAEAEIVDGIYQIANMGNLLWFAKMVNKGETEANAVLLADVEQPEGIDYEPIGTTTHIYKGEFDGKGHSVTLHIDKPNSEYQGIFGIITDGVHICNLIAKGSITGKNFVGGIAGGTNGGANNHAWTRFDNCGNEADVTATGVNAGGMIGVNIGGSTSFDINNCYNTGTITGGESGAFSGWSGGGWSIYRNCWNSGNVNNDENSELSRNNGTNFVNCYGMEGTASRGGTTFTAEQLANGDLCYKLNGDQSSIVWYQTLGTDGHPVYTGYQVYYNGETEAYFNKSIGKLAEIIQKAMNGEATIEDVENEVNRILGK